MDICLDYSVFLLSRVGTVIATGRPLIQGVLYRDANTVIMGSNPMDICLDSSVFVLSRTVIATGRPPIQGVVWNIFLLREILDRIAL
jgi:hypothetical protein